MDIPFVFGRAVSGSHFTDRKELTSYLVNNFTYGVNTIIISPRRYGKTSLVQKAIDLARSSEVRIVFMDIFAVRNAEEFCNLFASEILKQTASRLDELMQMAKRFLSRFNPSISYKNEMGEFTFKLNVREIEDDILSILDLPEKIAIDKGVRIVVCIDEFQQIGEFPDSLNFQKLLRSRWQHQKNSTYCLFGSKKHMMNELFQLPSRPFYKFGDVINLPKIPQKEWIDYIIEQFHKTGKKIDQEIAKRVCELTQNYSSYVQQLSWLLWVNFDVKHQNESLNKSYEELIDHCSVLFEQQTQNLTEYQINFLKAVIENPGGKFTSKELIDKYNLGTSANVSRLKASLLKKELIEVEGSALIVRDPILEEWIRRRFIR